VLVCCVCCALVYIVLRAFLDGYCSTVQSLLDWFEVDLGFTELLCIQIGLCVMCVFFNVVLCVRQMDRVR